MMGRTITIRLDDVEADYCDQVSRGNRSYYIRELIRRDMGSVQGNVYVPVIAEPVSQAKPMDSDFNNQIAKDTISKLFNF